MEGDTDVQTLLDVDYLGHNIKVTNKWNECSLIINGEVVDYSRALFAIKVTLRGRLEREYKDIVFKYHWTKLYLYSNDEQIVLVDLVSERVIVGKGQQVTVNEYYGSAKDWYGQS